MAFAGRDPNASAKHLDVDEEKPQLNRHCNECGPNSYCTHSSDDDTPPPFNEPTNNITAVHQILGPAYPSPAKPTPTIPMLNPQNLSGLLTENVDQHASGYLVFTNHGTLLASNDGTPVKFARKASALTALTWRLTEAALLSNGMQATSGPSISAAPLKTLETAAGPGGGELQMMVTEVEDKTLVVEYVKERILVAAMKETAEICKGSRPAEGDEDRSGGESVSSGGVEGVESENSAGERGSSTGSTGSGRPEGESSGTASESVAENLSKLQILKLKAEGLRDALRIDLKNFCMPDTFT
ncbi:hypothetical protein LPUS_06686 [Lasallia pustulata]|uniref:Uncharacterized protein n=1 Tax=Lasallia pustulata TaxID=136370 RepID=A0A1W5D1I1_9LECA|nr:hypothetical protein LPUS_06686 [Lasallia pustulata]